MIPSILLGFIAKFERKPTVTVGNNVEKLTEHAGKHLNELLAANKDEPVLLLLSGGSALKLISFISPDSLGKNATVGVLDERYNQDPKVNNFTQVKALIDTLLKDKQGDKCSFIDTSVKVGETQQELSLRFDKSLKEWRAKFPKGKIIITQGVGPDAHTSGIMPFRDKTEKEYFNSTFVDTDKWVVDYDAAGKNDYPLRVTTTIPFLVNEVDHSIVFATGKHQAFADLRNKDLDLADAPCKSVFAMKEVMIFTDEEVLFD